MVLAVGIVRAEASLVGREEMVSTIWSVAMGDMAGFAVWGLGSAGHGQVSGDCEIDCAFYIPSGAGTGPIRSGHRTRRGYPLRGCGDHPVEGRKISAAKEARWPPRASLAAGSLGPTTLFTRLSQSGDADPGFIAESLNFDCA